MELLPQSCGCCLFVVNNEPLVAHQNQCARKLRRVFQRVRTDPNRHYQENGKRSIQCEQQHRGQRQKQLSQLQYEQDS